MPMYPSGPHSSSYVNHHAPLGNGLHHRSSHGNLLHPLTPATPDDPHSPHHMNSGGYGGHSQGYGSQAGRDGAPLFLSGSQNSSQGSGYPYHQDNGGSSHSTWAFLPPLQTNNASGPLSSLLNPSGVRSVGQKQYSSPSSALPGQGNAASVSPDSRPTTGYSVASSMSIPYDDLNSEYGRPRSSSGRPMTPTAMNSGRPISSHGRPSSAIAPNVPPPPPSHLRIGRARRHSQAVSPYPSPFYDMNNDGRPVTAPDNSSVHRVRSFGNLPQVDAIGEESGGPGNGQPPFMGFNGSQHDFAYSAGGNGPNSNLESMDSGWMNGSSHGSHGGPNNVGNGPRPGTGASTMSAHSSASATQTPPIMDAAFSGHENDINRCEWRFFLHGILPFTCPSPILLYAF